MQIRPRTTESIPDPMLTSPEAVVRRLIDEVGALIQIGAVRLGASG